MPEATQVPQLAMQMTSRPRICTETGFNIEQMSIVLMSVEYDLISGLAGAYVFGAWSKLVGIEGRTP